MNKYELFAVRAHGAGRPFGGVASKITLVLLTMVCSVLLFSPMAKASDGGLVSVGEDRACAIAYGSLKCWGNGGYGALGNGSVSNSSAPVQVTGMESGVTAVSVGYQHTCAIQNGAAKCWGFNGLEGALGNGSTENSSVPVQVSGLTSGVTAISAGYYTTCAVVNGGVKCWGAQYVGSGTGASSTPADVTGLTSGSGATAVSVGYLHRCAVVNGGAKCWGGGVDGEIGNGSNANQPTPVDVSGLGSGSGVTSISAGSYHTCAVVAGGAKCWGYGGEGRLGNSSTSDSNVPVDVSGLSTGVTAISAGGSWYDPDYYGHSCAVAGDAAKCWGYGGNGRLGNGGNDNANAPVQVSGLTSGVNFVAAGGYSSCSASNSAVKCWGFGGSGALGTGTTDDSNVPVELSDLFDTTNPAVTIMQPTSGSTITTSQPEVQFEVDDESATEEQCKVDLGIFEDCSSPWIPPVLNDGQHTITVKSTDVASLEGTASVTFTVDTSDPVVTISSPAAGSIVKTAQPAVQFSVADASATAEQCKVDAGAFTSCSSPWTPPNLTDGQHTVTVKSTDDAEHEGISTVTFVVDTKVPDQPASPPRIASSPKTAKVGKSISLKFAASSEAVTLKLSLKIGKKKVRGLKSIKLKAGATSYKLKLPSKVVKQIKKALKKSKKTKVNLTITPSSASGQGKAKTVRIK